MEYQLYNFHTGVMEVHEEPPTWADADEARVYLPQHAVSQSLFTCLCWAGVDTLAAVTQVLTVHLTSGGPRVLRQTTGRSLA